MKKFFILAAALSASVSSSFAQTNALIDIRQDISLLRSEVGQLRMEVEELRNENVSLKKSISSLRSSSVANDSVRAQMSSVKASVAVQNEALKREIVASVKKDIDALAAQTNAAIQKLAKAVGSRPQPQERASFSTDYPKTGINYVVKSGDSISKIARANNSRIKWIMDANEISDAKNLREGAEIFIPQK